jgi:hypothetical protein
MKFKIKIMRKKSIITLVVLALFGTWACKKKNEKPNYEVPKISNIKVNGKDHSSNSSDFYKAGDTLNFSVTFTDDHELNHIDISQAHSGVSYSACGYDTIFHSEALSGTEQTVNFTYYVPKFLDMDQKNCITFYLKDSDDDKEGPKSVAYLFTINLKPESKAFGYTFTNARVYNYQSTNGIQCWNVYSNTAKSKSSGDFQLYNDTYSGDLSVSPGYKSGVYIIGDTKKAPSGFNYSTASDSLCDAIFNGLTSLPANSNVNVGDLFICKLGLRKYTVIKITNIFTTTTDNNDYTEFEYKRYPTSYYQ